MTIAAMVNGRDKRMSEYLNIGLDITGLLDNSPTHGKGPALIMCRGIEYMPVRHGHWEFNGFVDDIYGHGASCSVCREYSEDNGYYCSCCGAKMDDKFQRRANPEAFKGEQEQGKEEKK